MLDCVALFHQALEVALGPLPQTALKMKRVVFGFGPGMGFLEKQSGHDHCCFEGNAFEGGTFSIGSEEVREFLNEGFPCFS